jgi:hypothetical protein
MKGLGLAIIVLSEMCISTAMNWNELLDAADRSGDILACEEVHQSDLCASILIRHHRDVKGCDVNPSESGG